MNPVVVQYTGTAHIRRIAETDFIALGVLDQPDVEFNTTSPLTQGQGLVSFKAAEYLVNNEAFQLVEHDSIVPALRTNISDEGANADTDEGDDEDDAEAESIS